MRLVIDASPSIAAPGTVKAHQAVTDIYIASLDGLRFFAFLLVLIHHLPRNGSAVLGVIHDRGWIGVEIFFVLSAYLLFDNFLEEHRRTGTIAIGRFYMRRVLRLYPLMAAFPVVMLVIYGSMTPMMIGRTLALLSWTDNFAVWVKGYSAVPFTGHLWTLAYEFQIYLVLPVAFLLSRTTKRFWLVLIGIWLIAEVARAALLLLGVSYLPIWVTPFLRPESTLLGIALCLYARRIALPAAVWLVPMLAGGAPRCCFPTFLLVDCRCSRSFRRWRCSAPGCSCSRWRAQ